MRALHGTMAKKNIGNWIFLCVCVGQTQPCPCTKAIPSVFRRTVLRTKHTIYVAPAARRQPTSHSKTRTQSRGKPSH